MRSLFFVLSMGFKGLWGRVHAVTSRLRRHATTREGSDAVNIAVMGSTRRFEHLRGLFASEVTRSPQTPRAQYPRSPGRRTR